MNTTYPRRQSGVQTKASARKPLASRSPALLRSGYSVMSYEAQTPGPELSPTQLEVLHTLVAPLCGFTGVRIDPSSRGVYVVASATVRPSGALVVALARQPVIHTCTVRVTGATFDECCSASQTADEGALTKGPCRVTRQTTGAVELMGGGSLPTLDEIGRAGTRGLTYKINMLSVGFLSVSFLTCFEDEVTLFSTTYRSILLVCQHLPVGFSFKRSRVGGKLSVEVRQVNMLNDCTPLIVTSSGDARITGSYPVAISLMSALGDSLRTVMSGPARDGFLRTLQISGS
jgi:hypothetical protein